MDTIGLLAAWVGVISFLLGVAVIVTIPFIKSPLPGRWAETSGVGAEKGRELPDNAYLSEIISLYAVMILTLVAGVGVVILSILILDLGPAMLASTLPFNVDSKLVTRFTGFFLFVASYAFIFRLSYLAVRIRLKTWRSQSDRVRPAEQEGSELRGAEKVPVDNLVR